MEVVVKLRAAITQLYSFVKILCKQCYPLLPAQIADHSHYSILGRPLLQPQVS